MPHSYKENVCHYKDQARYFYSAMVSALDHSVDQVCVSFSLCVEGFDITASWKLETPSSDFEVLTSFHFRW